MMNGGTQGTTVTQQLQLSTSIIASDLNVERFRGTRLDLVFVLELVLVEVDWRLHLPQRDDPALGASRGIPDHGGGASNPRN